jgi:hypothetical protein
MTDARTAASRTASSFLPCDRFFFIGGLFGTVATLHYIGDLRALA